MNKLLLKSQLERQNEQGLQGGQLATATSPKQENASLDNSAMLHETKEPITSTDIDMINAFIEIDKMADRACLPKSVVDKACVLYKQIQESKQLGDFTNDAIISACVYVASRQEKSMFTFKEFCTVSNCSRKSLNRCFVHILRVLQIHLEPIYTDPWIKRLCSDLDLPKCVLRISHHIIKVAKVMKVVAQCDDLPVKAAAIFMASQVSTDKRTQADVENISGVASEAIQEAYRLMYPHAASLIPNGELLAAPIDSLPRI